MPGFLISNAIIQSSGRGKLENKFNSKCVLNTINNFKYLIKRNTLNRFLDDKLFYEDDNLILITEGIILNKNILIQKYKSNGFVETIKDMIN